MNSAGQGGRRGAHPRVPGPRAFCLLLVLALIAGACAMPRVTVTFDFDALEGIYPFAATATWTADPPTDAMLGLCLLDWGDGSETVSIDGDDCSAGSATHVYEVAGTYVATFSAATAASPDEVTVAEETVAVLSPPPNQAPVAVNDEITVRQGESPVIIDVLANDSDPDGDPIQVTDFVTGSSAPTGTSIQQNSDGTLTVGFPDDYAGTFTVTYAISDDRGGAATAIATLNVAANQPPTAVDDDVTVPQGQPTVAVDVLANDSDPDGDPIEIVGFVPSGEPLGTSIISQADGTLIMSFPSDYSGTFTIEYDIVDDRGGTASATVTVNVIPNQPPVAVNDQVTMQQGDVDVTIDVLDNDSDPEGDDFDIVSVDISGVPVGTLVVNDAETVAVSPPSDFAGTFTFTYTIADDFGGTATATVTVNVIPPPSNDLCSPQQSPELGPLFVLSSILFGNLDTFCGNASTNIDPGPVTHSSPSVTPRPRALDHTSIGVVGGTASNFFSQSSLGFLDSSFPCGVNNSGAVTVCPPGASGPLPAGDYTTVYTVLESEVTTQPDNFFYQHGFVFDSDGDPNNNFEPDPFTANDFFLGTDFWVEVRKAAGAGSTEWTSVVSQVTNGTPEEIASDTRVIVDGAVMFAIVPSVHFSTTSVGLRYSAFRHDGQFGFNGVWDGDVQRPVDQSLRVLPIQPGS